MNKRKVKKKLLELSKMKMAPKATIGQKIIGIRKVKLIILNYIGFLFVSLFMLVVML